MSDFTKSVSLEAYNLFDLELNNIVIERGYTSHYVTTERGSTIHPMEVMQRASRSGWEVIRSESCYHDSLRSITNMRIALLNESKRVICIINAELTTDYHYKLSLHSDSPISTHIIDEMLGMIPPIESEAKKISFCLGVDNHLSKTERSITVSRWEDISGNYPANVAASLDKLMNTTLSESMAGKFILWHGEPGTGKTYAIRALIDRWAEVCNVNYITDPEHFFGADTGYMMKVVYDPEFRYDLSIIDFDEQKPRWNLVIIEDAGEFISQDSTRRNLQALSRLLNICDGLMGQGLRLIVLITTNEDISTFHPAIVRPGRCLSKIEFTRLTTVEANNWLADHGSQHRVDKDVTIAELYAILNGDILSHSQDGAGFYL